MALQNHLCRVQSIFRYNLGYERIDFFFESWNLTAIYSKLRTGSISIGCILIFIEKLIHSASHNGQHIMVRKLYFGTLQEVVDTLHQRIEIHHIGDIGILDIETSAQCHLLCFFQIRSARKAKHIAEITTLSSPSCNHLTEFDFTIRSMMHLIDKNRKRRYFTYHITQLISHIHQPTFIIRKKTLVFSVLLPSV